MGLNKRLDITAASGLESNYKVSTASWVLGLDTNNSRCSSLSGRLLFLSLDITSHCEFTTGRVASDILCLFKFHLWIGDRNQTLGFGSHRSGEIRFLNRDWRSFESMNKTMLLTTLRFESKRMASLSTASHQLWSHWISESLSSSEDNQSSDHGADSI